MTVSSKASGPHCCRSATAGSNVGRFAPPRGRPVPWASGTAVRSTRSEPTVSEWSEALMEQAREALPIVEGELRVPGLAAPVEVVRDRWGVPHITASSLPDLFLAQGFVMGQERLFQTDF